MFSQFSQTGVGVADRVQKRPSTFARYKYLMYYEPMSLLLWNRLSITARPVPCSPAATLLMEASFFLERDVFVRLLWKTNSPRPFLFLPQKGFLPSSPCPPPLKKNPKPLAKCFLNSLLDYLTKFWFYHRKISEYADLKKKKRKKACFLSNSTEMRRSCEEAMLEGDMQGSGRERIMHQQWLQR